MSTLTSMDMNVSRSSTRVHAAPGGASSICFGTYGQDENVAKPVNQTVTNNIFGNTDSNDVVKPSRRPSAANVTNIIAAEETEEELEKKRLAAQRPSNSQGMGNVMTADVTEAPVTARRVRQAPGGTSSFTLG